MAADQSLIQATRAMGVSKYRDDSGWVKALASIGKYVASKQALKQQLSINSDAAFSTIEDADIEGLLEYKKLANEYTKIMAKQPSWSKKYKQATKDYNDLMQAVELNKAGNTAFTAYEQDIRVNNGQISKTHAGKEDNIGDEIYFGRYTKTFTNEGPSLYFPELGMDVLVKDLPTFTKRDEGKDVTTAMKNIVDKNGAKVKVKGGRFIEQNVSKDLNGSMSWWGDKKQRDIQMFDTEYTYNGDESYTFGKYIADKHGFDEILDEAEKQAGGFEPGEREATKDVMISMINEGNTSDYLKQEYKNFITEVSRQDHQVNKTIKINKKTGQQIEEPGNRVVTNLFDNSRVDIDPERALRYRNEIINVNSESEDLSWYSGGGYVFKPVLLEKERGVEMWGYERYNNGVKEMNHLDPQLSYYNINHMKETFGVKDIDMVDIVNYYKDEKEEGLP
jgi:hypothetical protein